MQNSWRIIQAKLPVIGHTDDLNIAHSKFSSNYVLSLERARNVAEIMQNYAKNTLQIAVQGKGDTMPIASNDTPERARKKTDALKLFYL